MRRWPAQRIKFRRPLTASVCLIVLGAGWFLRGPIARAFGYLQVPFSIASVWTHEKTAFLFESNRTSEAYVQSLEAMLSAQTIDRAQLEKLRDENGHLRALLAFRDRQPRTMLAARILARSSSSGIDHFVIDRGTGDGVEIGLPVIVSDGQLAGKISQVGETTAVVSGLNDLSFATAIALLNESRTIGVAEGQAGRLLLIRLIPGDVTLKTNDIVVTSGLEETIPSGILIGIVTAIRREENSPFQEAIIEPLLDLRHYDEVGVLLRKRL